MELIKDLKKINKKDISSAGGKGASLGEMTLAGIPVPPGFVVLSSAFDKFLEELGLNLQIEAILDSVNPKKGQTVENASRKITALIVGAKIPGPIANKIQKSFKALGAEYVAVRSSATAEDSSDAAWAGQLESYLNTTGEHLLLNVQKCWASLFTQRAIFYRLENNLRKQKISVAVVVQKMVKSEKSGIAFSVHPVTQDRNQLIIEAGLGYGDRVVSGQITPDSYVVEKAAYQITNRTLQTSKQVLSDAEILKLSKLILKIESHFDFGCDIEWAFQKGKFYIVQSRRITTLQKSIPAQKWIILGDQKASILEANMKLLAWSRGLHKEIGSGYRNLVLVKSGNYYCLESERAKIVDVLEPSLSTLKFIPRMRKLKRETLKLLNESEINPEPLIDKLIEHFTLYYLARREADLLFSNPKTPIKTKQLIEKWRNDLTSFEALDKAEEKMAELLGISTDVLGMLTLDELKKALSVNTVDESKVLKRASKPWSFILEEGAIRFTPRELHKVKEEKLVHKYSREISGVTVYQAGRVVRGIVGKTVLVAPYTSPSWTAQMRKMKAVITDEGGVLSHAAITCREFMIPCIVGTKVATQILKDGDRVEVDTNAGVIRILK